MKIEIDLNEILGDEFGVETIQDSVRRQVMEKLTREVKSGIGKKIDTEISNLINNTLEEQVKSITPNFLNEIINSEYTPVDKWGDRRNGKPTTFRSELIRTIHEQMVYKKGYHSSDNNAFTNAIDTVLKNEMEKFKKEFNSQVNSMFVKETLDFAVATLKKKLNIK